MKKHLNGKYLTLGLTLFLVIAACVAFLVALQNYGAVSSAVKGFFRSISPVFYGLAFAFLLNPAMCFFQRKLTPLLQKSKHFEKRDPVKAGHAFALIITMLLTVLVIYALFAMILPQLGESLAMIASNLSTYFTNFQSWLTGMLDRFPQLSGFVDDMFNKIYTYFASWLTSDFLPFFTSLTTSVFDILYAVFYVIIGLIISVYILAGKNTFQASSKKVIYSLFKVERANAILEVARYANKVFNKFIIGKIIDSAIIALLCFLGMTVFKMPYPLLISIVVGVTNVIPFFGPFLGAIPSTIFILVVDPMQALYFIIFIVVLQQLDGNLIGPHILGDATGVSGFWVVVSILVFSALFGFVGMVIAVPTFAVISMLMERRMNTRLEEKGLTPDDDFLNVDHIDPETLELLPIDGKDDSEA